jgi:hypothetical protein
MKNFFLLAVLALLPAASFAHGTNIAMTAEAITTAGEKFETDEAASLPLFTGVKGWTSADKILVKVYLSNNTAVNYTCSMVMVGNDHKTSCEKTP